MGNPAEDLVRLFVSTLSGPDRQKYWEKLLEKFYKFFLEALQSQNAPYSLEQVILAIKSLFKIKFSAERIVSLLFFVRRSRFGSIDGTSYSGLIIGKIILRNIFIFQRKLTMCSPDENVEEYQKVVLGKMEHLLDDVEKSHLHSRNVPKSYKKPVTRI